MGQAMNYHLVGPNLAIGGGRSLEGLTWQTCRVHRTLPPPSPRQNEILWREVVTLRQSHGQQHRVIGKVLLLPAPPTRTLLPGLALSLLAGVEALGGHDTN